MTSRDDLDPPRVCQLCGGDGWTVAPAGVAHNAMICRADPGDELACRCHAVVPCRCSAGRQADHILDRIADTRAYLPASVAAQLKPRRAA